MRSKIILSVGLLGALIIGTVIWAKRPNQSPGSVQAEPERAPASAVAASPAPSPSSAPHFAKQPPVRLSPVEAQAASERREAEIREATASINAAIANRPDDALNVVLTKLEDPEKEIRSAAINALILLDDRAAIPALELAITRTADTEDKASMQKAIDTLKLPSLTELKP